MPDNYSLEQFFNDIASVLNSDGVSRSLRVAVQQQAGSSVVVSGNKAITAAGTAEPLVAVSTPCSRVVVSSDLGNSGGVVVVGGSGVKAASTDQKGTVIVAGNIPHTIYIDDVAKVYADVQTSGDKIAFNYYTN